MSLPIVFIHTGYSAYLEFSLRQAKHSSPDSEIILLGNEANDRFDFVRHVNMKDCFKSAAEFAKIYQHYSTNPHDYEMFCFQRWFILKDFMAQSKIDELMVCDSDMLVYCSADELYKKYFKNYALSVSIHSAQVASAEVSFWRLNVVNDFCSFMTSLYTKKRSLLRLKQFYENLRSKNILGGYCDMIAVHDYISQFDGKLSNTQTIIEDAACDSHISDPHAGGYEYKLKYGKKKISWRNNFPYCHNKDLDKDIRFLLIHFQGPAKYLVASCYTGSAFKGMFSLKFKFFCLNIMAFWYQKLKIRSRFAFVFDFLGKS